MDNTGRPPDGEELAVLREQLAGARSDVERLQAGAADAEARAQEAVAEAAVLREDLHAAKQAATVAENDIAALREQLGQAGERERAAAERYRELVLRGEPSLPAELIAGDTVDAVDAAAEAARTMVSRVRSHIEAEAQAGRVPAGAPPRSGPDLGALSPEQKIRYGLGQRA